MEGFGWFIVGMIGIAIAVGVLSRPIFIARKKCYVCGKKLGMAGLKKKVHAEGLWYHYVCWIGFARHLFQESPDESQ